MSMKDLPKISVIICTYNHGKYLKECIESILAQTLLPFEIVICDDHSTDANWSIISYYSQQFPELIKPHRHKKNMGMHYNANFGLQVVTGDLITSLGGDDRWLPRKLELEQQALQRYPDARIAYSNVYTIDAKGNRTGIWYNDRGPAPPSGDVFVEVFSKRFFPNTRSVFRNQLMHRSVLDKVGYYDEDIELYIDWDLKIRLTARFPVVYSGEALVEYRVHDHGIHNSPRELHYRDILAIYRKNLPLLASRTEQEAIQIRQGVESQLNAIMPGKPLHLELSSIKPHSKETLKQNNSAILTPSGKNEMGSKLGEQLIFIISQPRAGSTLLQRILAGHPKIHTTAEPWIMLHPLYALKRNGIEAEYVSSLARQGLDDFLMQVPEGEELYIEALREMASVLYNRTLELSGKSFFLDKTPRYYFIIPELYRVFPKAKFIFLLRNPMAVLSSVLSTWFGNQIQALVKRPNYIEDMMKGPHYLVEGIKKLKEDAIVVHYENLAREPKEVIQHVCNRIGTPFYENMLEYGLHPVPKGRFGDSVGVYKHNRPVSDHVDKWVENLASPNLIEFSHQYLSTLGPNVLSHMGYSYQEMKDKLKSQRLLNDQEPSHKKVKESSVLNQQGEDLFNKGDIDGALNAFTKAIEITPNFASAHNNLGVLYWQTGEAQKAVEYFAKAIEIDPNDRDTIFNCGEVFKSLEKIEDAKAIYSSYLKRNPNDEKIAQALAELQDKRAVEMPQDEDIVVSAIVSTYNSEEFIAGCLYNLEQQSISDKLEIIVVNSGSSQNEDKIIQEFVKAFENIKYIKSNNRETIYSSWNRAAAVAKGKYLVNTNTDDRLKRDALEIMANTLNKKNDVGVVYIDQIITEYPNESFEAHHTNGFLKRPDFSKDVIVQRNPCGPQVMWRRKIHESIGYFKAGYEVAGDWDFWLRVSFGTNYTIHHIPELLGLYYNNQKGLEHGGRKQKERLREIAEIKRKCSAINQGALGSTVVGDKNGENNLNLFLDKEETPHSYHALKGSKTVKSILLMTSAAPSQSPFSTTEKRPPIGIGFLISVLRNAGHKVFFIDRYLQPSNFLETDYLSQNAIDYVGIYANTICYRDTLRMLYKLEWLRQTGKWKGKIVVGGPHTTVCLDTIPDFVDYVVQGEGEQAILDIVEGRVTERVVKYPRIKDLDELPMPAWNYFVNLPYDWGGEWFPEKPVFTMNTSRGCPFRCKFCSVGSIWGKRYTYFSAERIVEEIEYLIEHYGAKGIYFREDNFTLNKKRLTRFCNLLLEKGIKISWACETRVNTLDREIVELMARAGACGFYFGVESGSQRVLDFLKKDITVEQTRNAFKLCHEFGIKMAASVVVGVPTETEAELNQTIALLKEIRPTVTWFNVFVGIPNSELYQYAIENKLYEFIDDRRLVYLKGHNERVKKFYGGGWDAEIPVSLHQNELANPEISVVMSVHNGERYLKEAIESILRQTYQDFEFIIVDDASNDKTNEILESFDDPRIKVIKNSENQGLTKSLNKGIKAAKGKHIARMDADDISLPHRFEMQVEFLERNPDHAVVGSSYYQINDSGKICSFIHVLTDDLEIREGLKKQNWFGHGSVMMRKDAFLEVGGYDEQYKFAQDYDLWVRMAEVYRLANTEEPLYCWRLTPSCISKDKEAEQRYYANLAISEAAKRQTAKTAEEKMGVSLTDPVVSVIIPTHNRPNMLSDALRSILDQTYQNFEIIVINDAGVDVENIVTSLNHKDNITYVKHSRNRGLAAARNTGIMMARGAYIALLDDDDLFYPDHLETAIKYLNDKNPVIYTDAVRATFTKCGDAYKLIGKSVPYSMDFDRNKLLIGNIAPVNCFVFDRNLAIKAGLFDETFSTLEDWEFWLRLSALSPFRHIAQETVQVNWRTDGTTMTSSRKLEFHKNRERICKKYQNEIKSISNVNEIIQEFNAIWANDGKLSMPLVSIVILAHNQLEYTKKCIDSIFKHTKEFFELIVVDNGSTDGTVEYLESEVSHRRAKAAMATERGQKAEVRIEIIKNKENLGFAVGNNQGMAAAEGDYILLMNNDLVVTPGWLGRLIACAERKPQIGIVGPMSNYVSGPQLVKAVSYDTSSLARLNKFSRAFARKHAGQAMPFWRVVGFCMLIKRAVIEKIGGLDGRYGLGNFEDDDFSLRATLAGFESCIASDCFIHHFGSRTFVGARIDYRESLNKNWEIYKKKWGIPADVAYGASYDMASVVKNGFIPAKHYCPLNSIEYSMADGEQLFGMGDIEGAKRIFEQILSADSNSIEALNNLGVIAFQEGEIDQAVSYFTRVLEIDPDYFEAMENLGKCMEAKQDHTEGVKWFKRALELRPDDISLLNSLGNCFIQTEAFVAAREVYEKSLQLDSSQESIEMILREMGRLEEAKKVGT